MLVPSTFTGWYKKMMMKAEMASETSRSRAQTAITGSGRGGFCAGGVCSDAGELPGSDIVHSFYMEAGWGARLKLKSEGGSQIEEVKLSGPG